MDDWTGEAELGWERDEVRTAFLGEGMDGGESSDGYLALSEDLVPTGDATAAALVGTRGEGATRGEMGSAEALMTGVIVGARGAVGP